MVSCVNYWYNKKNMLGELIFVVACFKKALRDFRDHPEYPGPTKCRIIVIRCMLEFHPASRGCVIITTVV